MVVFVLYNFAGYLWYVHPYTSKLLFNWPGVSESWTHVICKHNNIGKFFNQIWLNNYYPEMTPFSIICIYAWIILGMGSVNEKMRYIITHYLISWAHTKNDLCIQRGIQPHSSVLTHLLLCPSPSFGFRQVGGNTKAWFLVFSHGDITDLHKYISQRD